MNSRRTRTVIAWMLAVLAVAPGVFARGQQSTKPSAPAATAEKGYAFVTVEGSGQEMMNKQVGPDKVPFMMTFGPGQASTAFYSGDLEYRFGDKAVKGAPFSAQVSTEFSQTLANGVHISHKTTGSVYRDSEGRMRREQARQEGPDVISIIDPVAGAIYTLRPSEHAATKISFGGAGSAPGTFFVHTETAGGTHTIDIRGDQDSTAAAGGVGGVTGSGVAVHRRVVNGTELKPKTESLGSQVIEGVSADGTRSTITIPAGTEGNDQPFDIVSERWYSSDLQMVVMSSHSDPRVGESVYRMTNINRAEPAHSLFDVPSDFTVTEEKGFMWKTAKPKEK
jgi:hypothetical protein